MNAAVRTIRYLSVILVAFVAMVGLVPASGAAAESNGGVRVMPLGDSITEGTQVPGGYRIGLWQRLAAAGYTVDLVGSQFNGPGSLGDHDHEGHPGWRIDQIDASIGGWLRTYNPRTVLLHIGTNDILQNYNVSTAPQRLTTLVNRITTTLPDTEVLVSTIIPLASSGQEAAARTFNAAIPGMVQNMRNNGKRVHFVDLHAALNTGDLIDGVHPTAGGYDKMAAGWYTALGSVPGSIGQPGSQLTTPFRGVGSGRCVDVSAASQTNGALAQIWDCNGQANQRWTRTSASELRVYGGKCLDVSGRGTADGTPVLIWDCNGQPNQQWRYNSDGTLFAVGAGKCLDVPGFGTANGTKLQIWSCTAGTNQRWTTS